MIFAAADDFGLSYGLEWVALVLVLTFIFKKFPGPLVAKAMAAKREQIRVQLAEREEAAIAAVALLDERRAALEAAKAEAATIIERARQSAAGLVEEGRRRGTEDGARIVGRAAAEIEAAHSRVRSEVIAEFGAAVIDAAEQVVAAEMDEPSQRRLIAEAIAATSSEVIS